MKKPSQLKAEANRTSDNYEARTCVPENLRPDELTACLNILAIGDAVDMPSARRSFPKAHLVAVAREQGQIVAVGAIKHERSWYAAKIACDSGVTFPQRPVNSVTLPSIRGTKTKGSSVAWAQALLNDYRERLFATTYTDYMKRTLKKARFLNKGKEWKGRKQNLVSLWEKV